MGDCLCGCLLTDDRRTNRARPPGPASLTAAAGQCCSCVIAELCCVLDFAGKPALPALLGRGVNLAGPSGYWVGHSSGSFAVGLLSVREPSLRARLPRIHLTPCPYSGSGRKGRGEFQGVTSHAADRPCPSGRAGRRCGSLHPGSFSSFVIRHSSFVIRQ